MFSDTKLYKVAITPCGKYVHGTEYDALCQVLNATEDGGDGCCYISKKPNKNVRPGTDPTVWAISVERGEDGQQGPSGAGFTYVDVSVDGTTGTPSATATIADDTFYLAFSGLKGEEGAGGKSTYQLAVEEGYSGTEEEWLASLNGNDGVGIHEIKTPTPADGTIVIELTDSSSITLNLNHDHPAYPKYYLCQDEQEYEDMEEKDSTTLYLIPEEE